MNPPPVPDPTIRTAVKPVVYGKNKEAPTASDELEDWRVLAISKPVGSVPTCELIRDTGIDGANVRIKDIRLDGKANHRIDVWALNDDGERETLYFAGEVVEEQFEISPGNEAETATATVPHYWFGKFCKGQPVLEGDPPGSPATYEEVEVHYPIEFNPMVDGKVIKNRNPGAGRSYSVCIDPESTRTEEARSIQGLGSNEASEWTLREVVLFLLKYLNPDEEFIKNPVIPDDWAEEAPPLKHIVMEPGHYLCDYLTMVLPPFGYDWCLDFIIEGEAGEGEDDNRHGKPIIRIIEKTAGDKVTLDLDAIGEPIEKSNMISCAIAYNIGNIRNKITGRGSLIEYEFTLPLHRAWEESADGSWNEEVTTDPIGRKLIANISGDYTGLRPEINEVVDLGVDYIPKRRRPEDCLRWRDSVRGMRMHPVLEFSDDAGETWTEVTSDWHPLPDEMGVWFSKPPTEILDLGIADGRFRLTCTIPSDYCVEAEYDDTEHSINGRTVEALVNVERRFHFRQRKTSGPYESVTTAGSSGSDMVDDSADVGEDPGPLQEYVDRIGEIMGAATVGITPVIHGIDLFYRLGDLVAEISGRNISLNCLSASADKRRYPQISGITYDFKEGTQQTTLTVTPFSSNNPDERIRRRHK